MSEPENSAREMAIEAARLADAQKAEDVRILDVEEVCSFTSYFVLATCTSSTHLRALGNRIPRELRERGAHPLAVAGLDTPTWVVVDYGDLVVHLLSAEARDYYRLEELWHDAAPIEWETAERSVR